MQIKLGINHINKLKKGELIDRISTIAEYLNNQYIKENGINASYTINLYSTISEKYTVSTNEKGKAFYWKQTKDRVDDWKVGREIKTNYLPNYLLMKFYKCILGKLDLIEAIRILKGFE